MQYRRNEVDVCSAAVSRVTSLLGVEADKETGDTIDGILKYLAYIKNVYEDVEMNLRKSLEVYFEKVSIGQGVSKGKFIDRNQSMKFNYHTVRTYHHTSLRDNKSISSYLVNGACIGGSVTYSLLEGGSSGTFGPLGFEGNAKLLSGKASFDVGVGLYDNGKLSPHINAKVGIEANLAAISILSSIGDKNLGATATGRIDVGGVYAKANAKVDSSGVHVDASIGAYAFKGEATAGFHIFGYYIEFEASATVGGASAGFEYQQTNNEWVVGAEASLLGGLGFRIKVGKEE